MIIRPKRMKKTRKQKKHHEGLTRSAIDKEMKISNAKNKLNKTGPCNLQTRKTGEKTKKNQDKDRVPRDRSVSGVDTVVLLRPKFLHTSFIFCPIPEFGT